MSSFDMIIMAIRNLWKRKLRTFLTVLGVVIGTASIVVMISIGIGMNESYKQQIESIGSLNVIEIYTPWNDSANVTLDEKTIEQFRNIEGVEIATPVLNGYFRVVCGRYVSDVNVAGILPEAMEAMGYKLESGRYLEEGDSMDIVFGAYVREEFFNPKLSWEYRWNSSNQIDVDIENDSFQLTYDYSYGEKGSDKSIKPKKVNVVGVLSMEANDSWSSVMPLEQVAKIQAEREKHEGVTGANKTKKGVYQQAKVKVTNIDDVSKVQEIITDMGFQTYSLIETLNAMQETSKMLQMVLGAIGAVSLLVAAIGIANTMIMSIYERTREIGIMKVIGATVPDIKRLFLTEAAFIGFLGGAAGIILSYGISVLVNYLGKMYGQGYDISLIPMWLAGVSVVFATIIGILAGYFPARRAMKLSAISAIRTE